MEKEGRRASERIELKLSIEVAGTDCMGRAFLDQSHTLVISRHGAKILLQRKLVPQQELTIRCVTTGKEADGRVVGQIGESSGSYQYGVEFLDEGVNPWDVEFPPLDDSVGAMGRVVLECAGCKTREVTYLNDFELEVLEANQHLSRICKRCGDVSWWSKSRGEASEPRVAPSPPLPAAPIEFQNRRREPRRVLRVTACVRSARFGDDLVKTLDVSRGGLCFMSPWEYVKDMAIEVAVPYSPGGGCIFVPAKIVRIQFLVTEGMRICGVAYQFVKG